MSILKMVPIAAMLVFSTLTIYEARAEETLGEKAQETIDDAAKNAKKTGRAASDKACPMVNGKLDCAMKKGKHKMQNAGDEIKDKADDAKKKID